MDQHRSQWLEGRVYIQVIGYGGESLTDIEGLVQSLQASKASAA